MCFSLLFADSSSCLTLHFQLCILPHNPAKADKSEEGGVGSGSGAGRAGRGRVGGGSRARAPGPEFYSILVEDVPGAGRERYTPPPPESGGLPPHNPFAPHPPHSDKNNAIYSKDITNF